MRKISEILDQIKAIKGVKKDTDLALILRVKQNTITTWRTRGTIPHDVLYRFCDENEIDLKWLLTGDGPQRKDPLVSEGHPLYNERDPALAEVIHLLKEHPQDVKLVLKLLKGKKDIKEALESLEVKNLIKEEGNG